MKQNNYVLWAEHRVDLSTKFGLSCNLPSEHQNILNVRTPSWCHNDKYQFVPHFSENPAHATGIWYVYNLVRAESLYILWGATKIVGGSYFSFKDLQGSYIFGICGGVHSFSRVCDGGGGLLFVLGGGDL